MSGKKETKRRTRGRSKSPRKRSSSPKGGRTKSPLNSESSLNYQQNQNSNYVGYNKYYKNYNNNNNNRYSNYQSPGFQPPGFQPPGFQPRGIGGYSQTFQEPLPPGAKKQTEMTDEDIRERLEGYREIDDPAELTALPKGTWLKFLSIPKSGEKPKYKMGGKLMYVKLDKGYLRLYSLKTKAPFSIQLKDKCVFVPTPEDEEEKRKKDELFQKWKKKEIVTYDERKEKVYEAFEKGLLVPIDEDKEKVFKEYQKGHLRYCDKEYKEMQKVFKKWRDGKLLDVDKKK